ncbi:MAG: DUF5110 domain-containing protein [Bacteroidales bacterium]|nr:DUF5110 domain-containing protein [Bacteroidales bacterium]
MKSQMICRTILASVLPVVLALSSWQTAQAQSVKGNEVVYHSASGDLRLQVCNERMIRITKSTGSEFPADEPWMVIKYDFDPVDFQVEGRTLKTAAMQIRIEADPWRLTLSDAQGRVLYQETGCDAGAQPRNECVMQADEHVFGFGERMDALDQRGRHIHLNVELGRGSKPAVGGKDILRAGYCPVPWFISNKGYALFFHNAAKTDWDMGWSRPDRYSFQASAGNLDYYLIVGPSIETMLHNYQLLTGVSPLMPRAAYGLHLGSYSGGTWKHEEMTSDTYPVQLVERMRSEGIPFDLLWLDSTWRFFNTTFGNGGCSFEFRPTFKDPQGMIDAIYRNHVALFGLHIRSIMDNGLGINLYDQAREAGITVPGARNPGIVNFFDQQAVDWWWDNAAMRLAGMGVKFFKTDVGSALGFPEGFRSEDGYSGDELHNLFPIAYAKAPYEKFAKLNKTRGFDHTREGYAGIQRYPFIWAGDWGTEWQWFEPVILAGLNMGLSGVGNWSHCMGGFEQYSEYDTDLYLRWCQMGMFSPVALLFGMDHPRYHEPWTYGPEAQRIFVKYDSLRYTLIPYIYSNAWQMYRTSRPLMTPLLYDYFDDELTYRITDQYLFGPSMMVCPVTNKGALSRPVYFPGGRWVDFWTGERIEGRQYKSFLTPPDLMPIFIREGAIIPKQSHRQYMAEKPVDVITLAVFPCEQSSYDLYEDDGISDNYQKGIYSLTHIESRLSDDGSWTLTIKKPEGAFKGERHRYNLEVWRDSVPAMVTQNNKILPRIPAPAATDAATAEENTPAPTAKAKRTAKDDGEPEGWYYDENLRRVIIHSRLNNSKDIVFKIN